MLTLHATTADDYHAALREHPVLLVDFHKDDCPGCRMLDMSLASVAGSPRAAGVVLLKVKLETIGEVFFRSLGLRQTPTLLLIRDGQEVTRLAGYQSPGKIGEALASVMPS
ncbi:MULTISPECIES: thioredoxin family protein [unclassified Stenotrophomonas]|uniref:thioredoxin family protein n=1 Tax=unclassified Stenotrophomonas TaxID=196198 RepID=UPI0013123087|nr:MULTISPECIES: thioredoxin family protein [unclassified Stenotrophomonas]